MRRIALFIITLASAFAANAQNKWQFLPDTGLNISATSSFQDVYFTDSVTGYTVTLSGEIYKTVDAGRNWSPQNYVGSNANFSSVEFLDDKQTGIIGGLDEYDNFYRTTDGGNSWINIASALTDSVPDNRRMICGIAHWNNTFYAVGTWNSSIARLYKSTDKGVTWKCYYPNTSLISAAVDVCFTSQDTGFITGMYYDTIFYRPNSVVIKTTDGGQSWKRVFKENYHGGTIWKIQAISSQVLVGSMQPYYSDTIAMIKSIDGGNSWRIYGSRFSSTSPPWTPNSTQGIGFVNERHGWLGGNYGGLYETWDGGLTWNTLNFGENFNRFFALDSSHVYAAGNAIYFYGGQIPQPVSVGSQPSVPTHKFYPLTPNPATGKVKIEFDLLNSTNVLLQVACIDSRRSWKLESRRLAAGHHTYYWDGSGLPAGNYMIWLGTDEKPIVQKFTLRH